MNTPAQTSAKTSKVLNIVLWVLQILVAIAFLVAGYPKLSGDPAAVDMFAKIGFGQWFRYATGLIEIIGAIMLLIPKLVPVGALLLICTMIGATIAHLTVLGGAPIAPLVLLVLNAIILWGRRERLTALRTRRQMAN